MSRDAWLQTPVVTDVMRNNLSSLCLYDTFFRHRGMLERFTHPEKKLMSIILDVAWKNRQAMPVDAPNILTVQNSGDQSTDIFGAPLVNIWVGDMSDIGLYNNGETWATVPEDGAEGSMEGGFYYWVNIHGLRSKDLARKRASELKATGDVRADLVATNIDYQRGERPASRGNGTREMTIFGQLVMDLKTEFKSIFTLSGHSPGTACKCLEADMPLLDLTPLPLLVDAAFQLNLLNDELVVATGDDGALELGVMAKDLLERKTGKTVEIAPGFKKKEGKKTSVAFLPRDLEKVKGKTVVIAEDMIDSGKTIYFAIEDLLAAGANQVIVLATHAVMSDSEGDWIKKLGENDKVKIIVTNSIRAELPPTVKATQKERQNIFFVDVLKPMEKMIDEDRRGNLRDIYSNQNTRISLEGETGLAITPWAIECYVDEAEELFLERIEEARALLNE